jgi:serine/threonine-protein kinase
MDSGISAESTRLGPYRIVRRLGIGGTSEVLLAVSQGPYGFERTVVLKRLLPKCEWDPSMSRMLAAEAVAYARLTHPAIVRLYDFFAPGGHVALVLEYVDGPSLARLKTLLKAEREVLGDAPAIYIAARVFAALAAAHSARDPRTGEFAPVIHRDVSPGNVLIPWDGFVKLGDFGLAKVTGLSGDTSAGILKGTFGYMAPEQVRGERVTPRTDVYAGCLLLRELLLSKPTFAQGKMPELEFLRVMAETQLQPIETMRGGISRHLADAFRRGLARDPEKRTLTAGEMLNVLRQETDLGQAHAALVEKLARIRPPEARASTPPAGTRAIPLPLSSTLRLDRGHLPPEAARSAAHAASIFDDSQPTLSYDTPNAVIMLDPKSSGSVSDAWPPRRRRAGVFIAAGVVGLAASVALAIALGARDRGRSMQLAVKPPADAGAVVVASASKAPPVAPVASLPLTSAPVPVPAVVDAGSTAPAPASTLGDIVTPERAHTHRVFVDGKYAAPHSGETVHVKCGKHVVRIGSGGPAQTVDVPCGGTINVE